MRLDQRIVELGLAATRSRARDLVKRGFVTVSGMRCDKPSREIDNNAVVAVVTDAPDYVSRGAEKLAAALDHFGIDVGGLTAIDAGASTGGFTDVLLRRGARRVYAVDVGSGQLHERIARDSRVVNLESTDARSLTADHIAEPVSLIVADVSFISLAKAIAPVLAFAMPGAWMVALIKPQFEVGPDRVGKGGVVRDEAARSDAVRAIESFVAGSGWRVIGTMDSPIAGGSGNLEYLIAARCDG